MNVHQHTALSETVNNFDLIARFYDELVSWAPYEMWVANLMEELERFGLSKQYPIVDLACGSGLSTIPLARHGYKVTGIDQSKAMLSLAKRKAAEQEFCKISFVEGDILDLKLDKLFQAAICMHSGLDYILEIEKLQQAFHNIRQILHPGGLLAFDKCLDEPDFYQKEQRNRRVLPNGEAVFDYRWDRTKRMFEQDCRIHYLDATGKKKEVRMLQKMLAVPPHQLIEMVEKAGFKTLKRPVQFSIGDPGMGIFKAV